jgi:hypothetical protein
MKNIPVTAYTNWLVEMRLLDLVTDAGGKSQKIVNAESGKIGISQMTRNHPERGDYLVNLYSREAQLFLIEHLPDIVQYWKNK